MVQEHYHPSTEYFMTQMTIKNNLTTRKKKKKKDPNASGITMIVDDEKPHLFNDFLIEKVTKLQKSIDSRIPRWLILVSLVRLSILSITRYFQVR